MINVCIIGYGYWGPNLCRNFSNANGYNLSAICDNDPKKLTNAKKIIQMLKFLEILMKL